MRLPAIGDSELRIISSNVLELTLITGKEPDPAPLTTWDFVVNGQLELPAASEFEVLVNGSNSTVHVLGFKRRPVYAPLRERNLRIGNHLYLQLAEPLTEEAVVSLSNPSGNMSLPVEPLLATNSALRRSPVIHVNQVGYAPGLPKKAFVGYYMGSAGELVIPGTATFALISTTASNVVFEGTLSLRQDSGYTYSPPPYQNVWEADFSDFNLEGEYRVQVAGLGVSYPFRIGKGVISTLARTCALGLYHQRCGAANEIPFTRHTHAACHTAMAEVPTMQFNSVNFLLSVSVADYTNIPRHAAAPLTNVQASLYPILKTNKVDVSGGHHDAGDYSKYTINSAHFIHSILFALDVFPGGRDLDNLGLPESGDGISDLLQLAKWEADFLCKMQDRDGGFYFLVYPRDRQYEHDVLPDRGDPQVVFPKTTAATAAAVAALAQVASSPAVREQYPADAARYLAAALHGWTFLEEAIATHGWDGAFQKITHYGAEFLHDDEIVWALTELFLATGDESFQEQLLQLYDPESPQTLRWGWWRLFEGYGCAARSYAFAGQTGRRPMEELDLNFLQKCRAALVASADDQLQFSQSNGYALSFPLPSKMFRVAGWFFPLSQAFELLAGYQVDPNPGYLESALDNMNYVAGANPLDQPFLTGIGAFRQREVVHQYAQNDQRSLPPGGIPIGAVQEGTPYLELYATELSRLTFPADGDFTSAYAPYDRWTDTFQVTTEFDIVHQARALAVTAFFQGMLGLTNEAAELPQVSIAGLPQDAEMYQPITVMLEAEAGLLEDAEILWEASGQEPLAGSIFTFTPTNAGLQWIEAEVLLPDGRRLFAREEFTTRYSSVLPPSSYQSVPFPVTPETSALYHFDFEGSDATGHQSQAELKGGARFDDLNVGWMSERAGAALHFEEAGDHALIRITNSILCDPSSEAIVLEWLMFVSEYLAAPTNLPIVSLYRTWNANLELIRNPYFGLSLRGGTQFQMTGSVVSNALPRNHWNHLRLAIGQTGYSVRVNGELLSFVPSNELMNWRDPRGVSTLTIGNFKGWMDEVTIRNVKTNSALNLTATASGMDHLNLAISGNLHIHYLFQNSTDLMVWNSASTNLLTENPTPMVRQMEGDRQFFKVIPIP